MAGSFVEDGSERHADYPLRGPGGLVLAGYAAAGAAVGVVIMPVPRRSTRLTPGARFGSGADRR